MDQLEPNKEESINKEIDFIENKEGKSTFSELELIKQRKEKIIQLLKKDMFFSAFILLALASFLFSFFVKINIIYIIGIFSPIEWLSLGIASSLSAFLMYNKKINLSFYPILAWIVFLAVRIRTRNLSGLKDITTGTWTLGPDLDPFLFLRWAKYIVEHGSLFAVDTMRYIPVGFETNGELLLHPYMIAWFHNLASFFGSESVTYSAILYPVFFFAITIIAFFFLVKEIFIEDLGQKKASITALISSFLLTIMPSLIPRTIAGIPEKESAAFFFLFVAFFLFLKAYKSKTWFKLSSYSLLSGISSACMALVWGGSAFLFTTFASAFFITFILGQVNKEKLYAYGLWLISAFILMNQFSTRYAINSFITSIDTGLASLTFFIVLIHFTIYNTKIRKHIYHKKFESIPPQIISLSISLSIILVITLLLLGPAFILLKIQALKDNLIAPSQSRLLLTVAENRQPFFTEWASNFGPYIKNIPIMFWLLFFGAIYLAYNTLKALRKKERIVLTTIYSIFLIAIIFSRYSPESIFNGVNFISISFYILGFILLAGGILYYLTNQYKNKEDTLSKLNFGYILVITLFFLGIVAARASVRTIMVLSIPAAIIVAYFCVAYTSKILSKKSNIYILHLILVFLIICALIFSGYNFYKVSNGSATGHIPSIYNQQWQKAMSWVRENTPETAVFGHWWDYGYWLQGIGERSTVLDGGNAKSYWNHLMGRHALTGTEDRDALEFLYAHNTTHFLIDSTDIGKYTAFSSIGSNLNYDRRSWLSIFLRDNNQVQETKNGTLFLYTGGIALDGDIVYESNETRIYLPAGNAGLGAVLIEKDNLGEIISQPIGIFVYQNQQYRLPLRYAYNKKLIDFNSGIEAGIFIFPRVTETLEEDGALIYLSNKTVKSQLARLYLYKEENPYFELVRTEDDFIVAQIKGQISSLNDIIYYNGFRGPIRIWKINYPKDIEFKSEYLSTDYPAELLKP